jgi:hypothetical protein
LQIPFTLRGIRGSTEMSIGENLDPRLVAHVTQSDINFATPRILGVNDWNGHLSLLRGAYPTWTFAEGLIG